MAAPEALVVGGFQPLSTTDWPDRLAAVVFVQGCPWRCRYCHNPALQSREGSGPGWDEVLATLTRRRGLLDGVVFSGGEPTLDPALPDAVATARSLGFAVGLHTAGIYPKKLQALLPALDWVGLDLKTDIAGHDALTGRPGSAAPVHEALAALVASGVDHEIRSTYHPALQSDEALAKMAQTLKRAGARRWVLQQWHPRAGAPLFDTPWHWPEPAVLAWLRELGPELSLR
ncbi:anaerobic ribonucleoside-triphosphate reductase activating protein [Rubrivivax gelatinosus]|uniref:Anaerobic ribonucleoside-triphosphate reductase activating protein n=1 Tax=Rubrivivax gelatinosus TaxID=28068 RepID=A0ABS1DX17_RUBGE|nr:anaerobic ribonucleoside-triphosphate reductase activating protein [Rubrivivax gelatinosus]